MAKSTSKALPDTVSILEDASRTGNVLSNDTGLIQVTKTKFAGSSFNVASGGTTIQGTYGYLTIWPDGRYSYTANTPKAESLAEGQTGTDVFTYTAVDASKKTLSTTLTLTVTGVNDGPLAVADSFSVKEDTNNAAFPNPVSGNVLANDTDVDLADTHTVSAVNGLAANVGAGVQGTYGTLRLNSNGSFTYTLDNSKTSVQALTDGQTVTDVFTYTNLDNHGASSITTVKISVVGTNDAPIAVADGAVVKENTNDAASPNPVSGNVLTNDTDPDTGDGHTISAVNGLAANVGLALQGIYGSLRLNGDGSFTYTLDNSQPSVQALAEGQTVTDVFSYTNTDNHGASSTATLTVTVTGTNDAPVAGNDALSTGVNTALVFAAADLLTNDSDLDKDALVLTAVSGNSDTHGTVSLDNGTITYIPDQDFAGQASFMYEISDGKGGSATGTVSVGVTSAPPVAVPDAASVKEDTNNVGFPNPVVGNVLANDTAPDSGDTHVVSAVNGAAANVGAAIAGAYGTLSLSADGAFTYTLDNLNPSVQALRDGQTATDVFSYTNEDNHGASSTTTLTVTVTGTNDAPTAGGDSYNWSMDTSITIPVRKGVLSDDKDVDGDPLHPVLVSGPSHGTLALNADGSFTYTPNTNYTGSDTFKYAASDGIATSNTATVSIHISDTHEWATNVYPSGDPAGLGWNPFTRTLFLVDSEADESPYFSNDNMLELNTRGERLATISLASFTKEPTGVAFGVDPNTGQHLMFVTDDDKKKVLVLDATDPLHPTLIRSFSTTGLDSTVIDTEDVTINPQTGNLYIAGELTHSIYEVTQAGDLVRKIELPDPITNPEGIAYDVQNNVFYVVGFFSQNVFKVSADTGQILETITDLAKRPNPYNDGRGLYPKGVELAPSSDDPSKMSLWVADYGYDQHATPDGRLFEIPLHVPFENSLLV